jgi:prepilin signal peptidase PulO-like enzyme (type II secretory pathway)
MDLLMTLFAFLFGTILGSFLNALLFRYNTGEGMGGRSHCMKCGHTLSSFELIPIFSWLMLGGRCHKCKSKISLQYPLVELTAGVLSLGVFLVHAQSPLLWGLGLVIWMMLLFIVVYDIEHCIIPLEALSLLGIVCFGSLFFVCDSMCHATTPSWISLIAGPVVGLPLLLLSAISKGRWMGWGDGLLMTALGFLLGMRLGLTAIIIGFWSGAIVGLAVMWMSSWRGKGKQLTMKSEIPFAPFLVFGAAVSYFFHFDLFSLLLI